jgi:hypothetical protein
MPAIASPCPSAAASPSASIDLPWPSRPASIVTQPATSSDLTIQGTGGGMLSIRSTSSTCSFA